MIEFLNSYNIPVIMGICLCIGFVIKHSLDFIPNKYIPLILCVIGVGTNVLIHHGRFSAEIVLSGLVSGLAATGSHSAIHHMMRK